MPDLYQSGQPIPELDGSVQGGITVICHNPDELTVLDAICSLAEASHEPLHVVYGLMNSPELSPDIWSLGKHLKYFPNWREISDEPRQSDIRQLRAVLSLTRELWERDPDPNLAAFVAVGRPGGDRSATVDIGIDSPGLLFHKGSLIATLMTAPLKVKDYSVALISRRGIAPSQRSERIMEDMRRKAEATPGIEKLERLEDVTSNRLKNKQGLIIFLHGLVSTDLGLFDGFIRLLNDDQDVRSRCVFAGWPHDSLASIESNALELRRWIEKNVTLDGPNVTFVCHSRGGLVARCTAVKLYRRSSRWIDKIRGCITFGTPHEGCPLAEQPRDMVGKVVAVLAASQTRSWWSVSDALALTKGRRTLAGIDDMRPINGGGDFLKELLESEAAYAPEDTERSLQIMAVGGSVCDDNLLARLSSNAFAGRENDLVVETRSSIPRFFSNRQLTHCDHFSYFGESEVQQRYFGRLVDFLKSQLALPSASSSRAATRAQ